MQQHAFFMLCMRQEHGALGVLPDLIGRFAYATSDLDAAAMLENIRRLALSGWVVLDEGVGELFVPRFMELNNVGKNPNRVRAAVEEAGQVESVIVRAAVADELAKIKRLGAQRAAERLKADQSDGMRPRSRRNISVAVRLAVYERDSWRCVYCAHQFHPVTRGAPEDEQAEIWLELDHINPYSRGGMDEIDNLRAACSTCNRRRGVDDLDLWADKIGGA
ncbi:HNH endonuclease [Nocardia puris]|uniref:HNH endonuclease n=1 Tax=Nocardia puris TaxID=208602 RepID=UPI001E615D52|nr:HNH endonuclease [Nocardia puris]